MGYNAAARLETHFSPVSLLSAWGHGRRAAGPPLSMLVTCRQSMTPHACCLPPPLLPVTGNPATISPLGLVSAWLGLVWLPSRLGLAWLGLVSIKFQRSTHTKEPLLAPVLRAWRGSLLLLRCFFCYVLVESDGLELRLGRVVIVSKKGHEIFLRP